MQKYYTRPCNFYYGNNAKKLIDNKKALPLAGNHEIAFDQVEVIVRNKKKLIKSNYYSIKNIKKSKKLLFNNIKKDLTKITSKRKNFLGIKFNRPQIMGILNITPDSFSDGGLYFNKSKAYKQAFSMIKSGAQIIDVGGESTKPGSKSISENGKVRV